MNRFENMLVAQRQNVKNATMNDLLESTCKIPETMPSEIIPNPEEMHVHIKVSNCMPPNTKWFF